MTVRNFKRFDEAVIQLGAPVVFVGPNNSGKTTALQALALWELGLRTWLEKRAKGSMAKQRVGVVLNRRDLVQLPVPTAALLWRDQHLRQAPNGGAKATQNVLLQVTVDGVSDGVAWTCPLEFGQLARLLEPGVVAPELMNVLEAVARTALPEC